MLSNISSKQKANEKYRQNHKEYYKEYYKKYRQNHKIKSYSTIYKKRLDMLVDKLYCWGEALQPEFQQEMLKIARGDFDE